MENIQWFIGQPLVKSTLAGIGAAALIDFSAFRSWKNFGEAYAYDWPLAGWRWLQGGITGFVTGLGLGAISG